MENYKEVKMKVCDRCKKQLDTNKSSCLNGESFELCSGCAEYIANHIRNYKPQKTGLRKIFG